MISAQDYRKRLNKMRANIHIGGEKLRRDDPRLEQPINVVCSTFDRAKEPELKGIATAQSHISGQEINRFCNVHHSMEDLLNKQKMTRAVCH